TAPQVPSRRVIEPRGPTGDAGVGCASHPTSEGSHPVFDSIPTTPVAASGAPTALPDASETGRLVDRRVEKPRAAGVRQAGWDARAKGDWEGARVCFEDALGTLETAEALEGLGWAAYCLDDDPVTFDARERAFRLYRRQGDKAAAARVAAWLAVDWLEFRG